MGELAGTLQRVTVWLLPVIFAVTLHEAAHGYAALALGDDTAKRADRLSLNPLRHIDPFGTLVLPGIMLMIGGVVFGWAKPVPVNFFKLKGGRLGMVAVAAAGPLCNLALAALAAVFLRAVPLLPPSAMEWVGNNLKIAIYFNLLLAVFNMIPIPPLDGGRVAVGLLPRVLAIRWARLESVGVLIILGALVLLPALGRMIGVPLDLFGWLIDVPLAWLADGMLRLAGVF